LKDETCRYLLLVGKYKPEDVRRLQAELDAGTLDPEELVRQGKAIADWVERPESVIRDRR
jgi:hypothetical protein